MYDITTSITTNNLANVMLNNCGYIRHIVRGPPSAVDRSRVDNVASSQEQVLPVFQRLCRQISSAAARNRLQPAVSEVRRPKYAADMGDNVV